MRSPFRPAIFAQSSGLLVFGRSSFSCDHRVDGRGDAAVPSRVRRRDGEVGRQVLLEDVAGGRAIGSVDLDLHVEAAGPQDRGIDQVRAV